MEAQASVGPDDGPDGVMIGQFTCWTTKPRLASMYIRTEYL